MRIRRRLALFRFAAVSSCLWCVAPGLVVQSDAATPARSKTKVSQKAQKSSAPTKASSSASNGATTSTAKRSSRYSASRSRSRRARLARALAIQRAREYREAVVPRFKSGADGEMVPDIRAAAAVVYDPATQEVLWEEHGDDPRSIASITKVMTAVVFLEHETDVSRVVTVERSDTLGARHTYLRAGERVRVDDLLNLLLVASDNAAARTLARVSPFGPQGFVERMNSKAEELGLLQTYYVDPSGLYAANMSSARDMARLIAHAAGDERIGAIMQKSSHQLTTSRRTLTVNNTNRLVGSELDVRGGKTGFIRSAGYCLATLLKLPQRDDPVAVVVLGARSNAGRFWETRHIANWLSSRAPTLMPSPEPDVVARPIPE